MPGVQEAKSKDCGQDRGSGLRRGPVQLGSSRQRPYGGVPLVGRLKDQAALAGVLNTLYELHIPILAVEKLNCQ